MPLDRTLSYDSKADFVDRIARIQAGGLNTNRTLFIGNAEALVLPPGTFVKKRRKARLGRIFAALVLGCGAVVAGLMAAANLF